MNPSATYMVLCDRLYNASKGELEIYIHLHKVKSRIDKSGKVIGERSVSEVAACGYQRKPEAARFNLGNRTSFPEDGMVNQDPRLYTCGPCEIVRRDEPPQKLYSVAYESLRKGRDARDVHGWKPNLEYFHADDGEDANIKACEILSGEKRVRIVAIAPVLGYHVLDSQGDKLSV